MIGATAILPRPRSVFRNESWAKAVKDNRNWASHDVASIEGASEQDSSIGMCCLMGQERMPLGADLLHGRGQPTARVSNSASVGEIGSPARGQDVSWQAHRWHVAPREERCRRGGGDSVV